MKVTKSIAAVVTTALLLASTTMFTGCASTCCGSKACTEAKVENCCGSKACAEKKATCQKGCTSKTECAKKCSGKEVKECEK